MFKFNVVFAGAFFKFHHLDLSFVFISVVHLLLWWVFGLHPRARLLPLDWSLRAWDRIIRLSRTSVWLLFHIVVDPWAQLLLVHVFQLLELLREALLVAVIYVDVDIYVSMVYQDLLPLSICHWLILMWWCLVERVHHLARFRWHISSWLDSLPLPLLAVVVRGLRAVNVLGAVVPLACAAGDPRKIMFKFTKMLMRIFILIQILMIN